MQNLATEKQRLAALEACRAAGAGPEPVFDRITRLAAQFFACPIAVVSLVEEDSVCFKSHYGTPCEGVQRDGWFCAQTILSREPLVIPDASCHAAFAGLSQVCGAPRIRFYAGAPLIVQGSCAVGALAILDTRPREPLGEPEFQALRDYAALVAEELDRRIAANDDRPGMLADSWDGIAGALPAMVWVTDREGNCTLLNRFDWDDAASPPASGKGHDWLRVIPSDEHERNDKADLTFECRVPGAGGEDRWILEQARPRFGADGSFAGYIGLCLDITDRKETEEALRETQEWLTMAQNAAGIGLWDWDMLSDISKCSDQLYRLYGLEPREAISFQEWLQTIHPDDREGQMQYRTRIKPVRGDYESEFRCVWPDGSIHWLYSRAKIYYDEHGRAVRALGANIDINDFKRAEERRNRAEKELIASREQLRQLAAHLECTREQERIRISREIHDELGQILTVLKMDLEAVEARYKTSVPRPLRDITRRVAAMVKNLDIMIDTVRRIASELRPAILDHLGLAAAIEWQLQDLESRTGIRCHAVGLPEHLPLDARQSTVVFRILQEMLTNVVRHAAATAIKVDVQVESSGMTLLVTDNGKGFDVFHVADPDALGLLGMRERALLLGGTVELESRPGRGTSVTLRIPLSEDTPPAVD